jgi:DNA (cytosine-5)-methyltransferase 1
VRPRLVDWFCGAGGAAKGYQRAGFYVVGVDIEPQPNYCGDEFIQADALTFPLDGYDAIHASPPCQHYANVTRWRGTPDNHPDLVGPVRARLNRAGVPYVIENVRDAGLVAPFMLCGSQFGLPVRRHRYFETSWHGFALVQPCQHRDADLPFMHKGERAYADAMGCQWMTAREGRQAIPPAYTEWVGRELLERMRVAA